MTQDIAKILIIVGIMLVVVGVGVFLFSKAPFFGKLPGDIVVKKESFTFIFPVMSCVVISVIVSIVINIFLKK